MLRRQLTINDRYRLQLAQSGEQRATSTLANPAQWLTDMLYGSATTSGATVNDTTAMSLPAVFSCVRVLADSIASLPIGLFRSTPDGGTVPAISRPENSLIGSAPSSLYTSYSLRSTMQLHLGLRGNAYARILRDGRGGARELIILHPSQVYAFFDSNKLYYRVEPNPNNGTGGRSEILTPDDIIHVAGISNDGINGISPIQALRESIGLGITNRANASRTIQRGRADGYIKYPGELTTAQGAVIRDTFADPVRNGEFPVLGYGMEYQAISLSPQDAEFINTHKLTVRDIAGAYRVPLHMIGDLERATFSNIEHQSLEFVKFSLMPWIKAWEMELNRKLIPYSLQNEYFFRFNVDGLLRGDIKTRMDAYTKAIQWGILNRDEARELENRNPIPDGLGEVFLTPLNMAPLTDQTVTGDPNADNTTQNNGNGTSTPTGQRQ